MNIPCIFHNTLCAYLIYSVSLTHQLCVYIDEFVEIYKLTGTFVKFVTVDLYKFC